MSEKRNSYLVCDKAKIIQKVADENVSISGLEAELRIPGKCIRDWLNNSPKIMQCAGWRSPRLPGAGRKPSYPELEKCLLNFVKEKRLRKLIVNKKMIQNEALNYAKNFPEMANFKASLSWVRKFCVRNFLTYRTSTHQSQHKKKDPNFEFETLKTYI